MGKGGREEPQSTPNPCTTHPSCAQNPSALTPLSHLFPHCVGTGTLPPCTLPRPAWWVVSATWQDQGSASSLVSTDSDPGPLAMGSFAVPGTTLASGGAAKWSSLGCLCLCSGSQRRCETPLRQQQEVVERISLLHSCECEGDFRTRQDTKPRDLCSTKQFLLRFLLLTTVFTDVVLSSHFQTTPKNILTALSLIAHLVDSVKL